MLTDQRKQELQQQCRIVLEQYKTNEKPWGACTMFLDSINTLEEFEVIVPLLEKSETVYAESITFWREGLVRWADPKLPSGFVEKFPLLASRLDTPQKVRIFLRAADFRDVDPLIMGGVFEDILLRHEVNGEKKVVYQNYRGNKWCDALRIVYHTQVQAWTLKRIVLPDAICGTASYEGLFIDWRTEEERKAADSRW